MAFDFRHVVAPNPSCCSVMPRPMSLPKPISSALFGWPLKGDQIRARRRGVRREEFGSRGVRLLQGGKPLGFPNPRAKLSLGKKMKI